MTRVTNTTQSISRQFDDAVESNRNARLQARANEVYRVYREGTPLLLRILAFFRPEFHTTVKWICTCLEHVKEFNDTELLGVLKKDHRSLRLALDDIGKMTGPDDLKGKAIKFAAENAEPDSPVVDCRYQPDENAFYVGLAGHETRVTTEDKWKGEVLGRGLEEHLPFYSIIGNLKTLAGLTVPGFTPTETDRNACLCSAAPLESIAPEVEHNNAVAHYNDALVAEQNAVRNAFGGQVPDWLTPANAVKLLSDSVVSVLHLAWPDVTIPAPGDGMTFGEAYSEALGGGILKLRNGEPVSRSKTLFNYTVAGLDVPVPEKNFITGLREVLRSTGADVLQCQEQFVSTFLEARSACEHYRNQMAHIRQHLPPAPLASAGGPDALSSKVTERLELVERYHAQAWEVLGEMVICIGRELNEVDALTVTDIESGFRDPAWKNLSAQLPVAEVHTEQSVQAMLADSPNPAVQVEVQHVQNKAQWLAEAMFSPVPISPQQPDYDGYSSFTLLDRTPTPPPSRTDEPEPAVETILSPPRDALPEPRSYENFASGAAVLEQMNTLYPENAVPEDNTLTLPERPHSTPPQRTTPVETVMTRSFSFS